ncbi:hypothetical protein [Timonella sp. A28]|uniref:hypothetical protein n=1 Tax=Timonella sp. A28 TaxID=3442640 RepID=UPI003EB73940
MRLEKTFTPHTVTVTPFLGEGANGEIWGPASEVRDVFVEDVQEVVIDDSGKEVVSSGRVIFNFDDAPLKRSKVTVWAGTLHERTSEIFKLALNHHDEWPSFAIGYLR